jgi:alginate production protein
VNWIPAVLAAAVVLSTAPPSWAGPAAATGSEAEPAAKAAAKSRKPGNDNSNGVAFDIDAPPKTKNVLAPFWTYGGHLELEFDLENNFDLGNGGDQDLSLLQPSLEMALSYTPSDDFKAFLDVTLTRNFALQEEGEERTRPTRLKITQANVAITEIFDGFSLKIGRQRFKDNREWLYDDELDAIKLYYRHSSLGFEASVSRKKLVDEDLLSKERNERINNYFLVGRYKIDKDLELGGYVLVRDDRSSRRERPIFLGVRARGEAFHDLEYWADLAHVRGRDRFSKTRQRSDDIRGFGFDLGATYAFDLPLSPSLTLDYAFGTGDSDSSDGVDHSFRQTDLQDNNARFNGVTKFKYYGELFEPELSNLSIFTAGAGIKPSRRSSIDLVYHHYRQDEASDDIRDSNLEEDPTGLSRSLGSEVDLVIGFREIKNLNAELAFGYFRPGDAFPDGSDDAFLASFDVLYRF